MLLTLTDRRLGHENHWIDFTPDTLRERVAGGHNQLAAGAAGCGRENRRQGGGVADRATVAVLDAQNRQHKVRLTGIDAPENAQAFGQQSKESLSNLVFNQVVTVQTHKTDDYGRQLGQISRGALDVNLERLTPKP